MQEVIVIQGNFPFTPSILAGRVAPSSLATYTRDFKAFLLFAKTPEEALKPSTLARWRQCLAEATTYSPNTINRMVSSVHSLMREAEEQGYIPKGTAQEFKHIVGVRVEAMKHRKDPHARTRISPEEMRAMTNLPDTSRLIGKRDSAMLHTFATSGIRVDELSTLTVQQIKHVEGGYQLEVMGKNKVEYRDVPLSPEAYRAIQEWLAARPVRSDYVFTGFAGSGDNRATVDPMNNASIWKIVRRYAKKIGLEHVKTHDIRRLVGTQLAKRSPRNAQKVLGHKKMQTTFDNYVLDDLEVGITDNLY